MSARSYGILMRIVAVALAAVIGMSLVLERPLYVPISAIMVALLVANICRRFVKEVMTDERSQRIDEKAASLSYRIYTIVTAIFVLLVLGLRSSLPPWASIAGETLAYSLCILMLVHLAISRYISRKL